MPAAPAYNPFPGMAEFQNRMSRFFNEPFANDFFTPTAWTPPVEFIETAAELIMHAELPGMDEKDVEIVLENNVLTFKGEKKTEMQKKENDEDFKYLLFERNYGSFVRSFTLPFAVDPNKIKAEFAKGMLTVWLPKSEEVKGRRIPITKN